MCDCFSLCFVFHNINNMCIILLYVNMLLCMCITSTACTVSVFTFSSFVNMYVLTTNYVFYKIIKIAPYVYIYIY